jgi:hypothetical protein
VEFLGAVPKSGTNRPIFQGGHHPDVTKLAALCPDWFELAETGESLVDHCQVGRRQQLA